MTFFSVRVSSHFTFSYTGGISFAFLVSFLFKTYLSLLGNNDKQMRAVNMPMHTVSSVLANFLRNTVQYTRMFTGP
jgi:hypothetical protein